MEEIRPFPTKNDSIIIISLLALLTFLTQFVFRSADDNRLTSWQWTFAELDVSGFFLILIAGIAAAYLLSRYTYPERSPALSLFIISFSSGVLFWQEPEVILDTSRYFTQAKHLEIYGIRYFFEEWGREIHVWTDLPLVPFLYGLIFKFFGESRLFIQIFTTFLFSMTALIIYYTGKILWDSDTGFYAGILLLGIPYIFTQVPLMLVDIPTMFFLAFAVYSFIKALLKGGSWIFISSFAIFLALFSKYSTWLMLSVLVVIFMVYLIQNLQPDKPPTCRHAGSGRPATRSLLIYRGALIALFTVILAGIFILYKYDVIAAQIELLNSYQKPGLKRWGESFISTFFFQVHPFVSAAAIFSIFAAIKKKDLKYLIISSLILLIFLLQIRRARYTLVLFPMLTMMASYGLQVIRTSEVKRFIVLSALISSLAVAVFSYLPFMQKMSPANLMNAGAFLDTLAGDSVKVYTVPAGGNPVNPAVAVPVLDLFTEKNIHYDYDTEDSPPFSSTEKSSVRFTWDYKNPAYYNYAAESDKRDEFVAVITESSDDMLPNYIESKIAGYSLVRNFKRSTGVFQYRPGIKIFRAD